MLDLGGPHLLEGGGVIEHASGWLISGVHVKEDAAIRAQARDLTEVRTRAQLRTPIMVHEHWHELPLPIREAEHLPMEALVPVRLSDGRWGVLWSEAVPPAGSSGRWSPDQFTQLWFAEHSEGGWLEPRMLLSSALGIERSWNRTAVRFVPGRATFLIIIGEESVDDGRVMFGSVEEGLVRVPVADELRPVASSILVDGHEILAAIQVLDRSGGGLDLDLIMLRTDDEGLTWSAPERIWHSEYIVQDLRFHRDGSGILHLLWLEDWTDARHIRHDPASGDWFDVPVANDDGVFAGVTGIDKCGRLTMVRQAIDMSGEAGFRLARWTNARWVAEDGLAEFSGMNLFDGIANDGTWQVGWSGDLRRAGRDPATSFKVWLIAP